MNNRKLCTIATIVMMTALLSLAGGLACAADSAPMTPEYAAKHENTRKQQNQRITNKQRKAAADDLKAKRLEVYKAKQAVKHSKPENIDNK